tara:strand:- start:17 stop:925 length:909 start_codon:yes stop_codon:yes gene_type:complete
LYKYQRTLNDKIIFSGIGLHTGVQTKMVVYPAEKNSGISFKRIDLDEEIIINASINNIVETNRGTTIGINNHKIYTVEHFLSALNGLGIDNAFIEINNIEPPIFDGSSEVFVNRILEVGIRKIIAKKKYINIAKELSYDNNSCKMKIIPCDKFKISYFGDFSYGNIGSQDYIYTFSDDYKEEISKARTFCSINELIHLKRRNLIKGANLDSGIVFLDDSIDQETIDEILLNINIKATSTKNNNYTLNNISLRYENEPIRHKILDLIGDFSLLGFGINGHIISYGGGHESNVELMKIINNIYG